MESKLHLSVGVAPAQTQLLLRLGRQERLRAVLPPPYGLPRSVCPQLLAALASWFNQPLHVALVADCNGLFQELGISNPCAPVPASPPVEVHLIQPQDRLALQLYGASRFTELRRVSRESITPDENDRPFGEVDPW